MTMSLPSYLKTLSLAALLVLPTLAIPLPAQNPGLGYALAEDEPAPGGLGNDPLANSNNAFHLGKDISVVVGPNYQPAPGTSQLSSVAVNATLTALHKAFIEPSNAKVDPLDGPLNVTLDDTTAGVTPTDFSSWGSKAPPPSFAQLPYATWAKIVQGLQTFLGTHKVGEEVKFTVTKIVPGGGSNGLPEGAVVAKGFVKPVAGN